MASSGVVIRDQRWREFVSKAILKLKRTDQLLRVFGRIHGFQDIIDHFKQQKGPSGSWPKRAASTQKRYASISSGKSRAPSGTSRASFNPTNRLLQQTGRLRQSIAPSGGSTRRVNRNSVALFSRVKYSGIHEFGSRKNNIPERSFMWLSNRAKDKILSGLLKKVTER